MRELMDSGEIIGAGWAGFKLIVIPPNAPQDQLDEMRVAFYAGAEHLWSSIMSALDPGTEATPADLRRLDLIAKELETFRSELAARVARK